MTRSLTIAVAVLSTSLGFSIAQAATPQPAIGPPPVVLPVFGFQSYNLHGVGEQVTFVACHSMAERIGLEPGDRIVSMNGFALTYHGAWEQALRNAMLQGGQIHLDIRDVRTGLLIHRDVFAGSPAVGPVTPKVRANGTPGPTLNRNLAQPESRSASPKFRSQGPTNLSPPPETKAQAPQPQQSGNVLKRA